jgi:hypothetical protein
LVEHKRPDYAALWARSIALPATALNEIGDLYRVLRDGGPREAADAWLSERKLGPVDFEGTQRQYELGIDALTDDVPLTTDKIMAAPVRVTLQAIVLGRKRALSGAAFEALRAEAAMAEAVSDPAWQPARVLLGLDPPEALPAAPPKGTWAVAEPFARATLAESRGRYDEAVEGYMDTLDLLSFRRMEWEWARKRLEEFTKSGKSIQRLIREGL